jgi:paraquat-inducible protein B
MGQAWEKSEEKRKTLLTRLVEERGMRAQLKSGSLLTGQLYVALRYFPSAPKAKVDWSSAEPELPTVESLLPDLEQKLPSIIAKLDKLPLEEIGANLKDDLATLNETLKEAKKVMANVDAELVPELKSTLEDARKMIASADRVMKSADATLVGPNAPMQQELRDTLQEVTRAVRSLRVLTDYLERHPEALLRGKTEPKGGRN